MILRPRNASSRNVKKKRYRVQLVQVIHFGSLPPPPRAKFKGSAEIVNFMNFAVAYRLSRTAPLWPPPC
jgi:hypothetical protein